MLAALLALASSFCYGSSDFIAGLQSRRRSVWSIMAVSQPVALIVAGALLLAARTPLVHTGAVLAALLGGVALAGAAFLYYRALALGTMSVVAPIASAGVLVPVVVGLASGDRVSPVQYAGMALAIAGILLSSRAEARSDGPTSVRSVLLAAGSAMCFGLVMLALAAGGSEDVYWSVFALRLGATATVLVYLLVRRPRLSVTPRAVPALIAVGILAMAANALYAGASTVGYLSVVAVLASLGPVVVAILARSVLRERLSPAQLGAALVVLAGVVCLAAG